MAIKRVTVGNPGAFRRLSRESNKIIGRELLRIARSIVVEARRILRAERHIATGALTEAFEIEVINTSPPSVVITNNSPHALVVEFGRRPGSKAPPPEAVVAWYKAKFGATPSDSVSYLIGQKIARDGIPAVRFLSRALANETPNITNRLEVAVKQWLDTITLTKG